MSTADSIWWQRNVVSYDQILESIGKKNDSSPQLEDLSMFNQETAPDPMELMMEAEVAPIDVTGLANLGYQPMEEVQIMANTAKKTEEPQVQITPALDAMLREMADRSFSSLVRGGNWVGTLLKETDERDYIADLEETQNGVTMAVNGIEYYAFNRDVQDTDPARKSMTTGQWNFLNNMADQVVTMIERVDVLEEAGYKPQNSFTAEYEAVRGERLEQKRKKASDAALRDAKAKGALNEANTETKTKLKRIFG